MKASELRIGNFITQIIYKDTHDEEKEILVDWQEIWWISKNTKSYRPIILTEEWLLKFGFDKRISNCFKLNNFFIDLRYDDILEKDRTIFSRWDNYHCLYFNLSDLKYVHQLQNLYFALTGEELTLNQEL
jgi:hypothetical protein